MKAPDIHSLIQAAAKWAVFYSLKSPSPLFATPCYYFTLDARGLPDCESIHFVRQGDALHAPPEAILRRARSMRRPSTHAAVVVYALSHEGDIHAEPAAPYRFLVYTYVPSDRGTPAFERRIVEVEASGTHVVHHDALLPFDRRIALQLAPTPQGNTDNRQKHEMAIPVTIH